MADNAKNNKVKKGFGIKKDTRGSSAPKFKLNAEENNGLNIGILKEVTVGEAVYGESQKGNFTAFAGKTVPTINFVFTGIPMTKGDNVPVYIHSFKPMPIIAGKFGWFYDSMFQTIKHFIDVYTGEVFRDEYEDLLDLAIDPDDTETSFEDLHAAYVAFFNGVATVFNGNGKDLPCIYKDAKANPVAVWLKLLLYFNNNEVNNGNPGFSGYPGDGIIELCVEEKEPTMRIAIEKGESIIPREKGANKPNVPQGGGGAPQGGADTSKAGAAIPNFMKK